MNIKKIIKISTVFIFLGCSAAYAKEPANHSENQLSSDPEFDEILARDITDLTVTSVAKRSQQLKDTAAAVYVITQDDLRRAGVYTIPEALRLVPGMQVARVSSNRWAVSARGFNNGLNNKLLVLIDGRAIYTPVFSGVYWDDQSTSINDIERIEVIRGPGASLYGANAVNGVINIITKSAEATQGNLVSAAATNKGNGLYEARHGGKIGKDAYYRVYGQYFDNKSWFRGRVGFRMDGKAQSNDSYTLQGDAYSGTQDNSVLTPTLISPYSQRVSSTDDSHGANILGRWNHKVSADSDVSVQAYLDNYSRNESTFNQNVSTADVQLQNSIRLDERNNFVWGTGVRLYYEDLAGSFTTSVSNRYSVHDIFNVFAQNEYALVPSTLFLTLGSKFEHNDFSGFEAQPSARLLWHPTDNQTVWGAVSRAVRTPSSIEEDVSLLALVTPTSPLSESRIFGNAHQQSEELIAYELGHRIQVNKALSFDTALFYNDFDRLLTIGAAGASYAGANGNTIIPYTLNNLGSGRVYGGEFATTWNIASDWKLSGSYSYLKMDLDVKPGAAASLQSTEDLAPRHQFALQSYYNISDTLHWDNMLYYVDNIKRPVDSYVRYDTRIAWLVQPGVEVSLIGKNLFDDHEEFPATPQLKVGESFVGQILWKF